MTSLSNDLQRIHLQSCMDATVDEYVERYLHVRDEDMPELVLKKLEFYLRSPHTVLKHRQAFYQARQKPSESFLDRLVQLKRLANLAELTGMSEEDQVATILVDALKDKDWQRRFSSNRAGQTLLRYESARIRRRDSANSRR